MPNKFLSLENLDQDPVPEPEPIEEAPTLDEARVVDAEIEADADQLDEAAGIDTALERTENILERGVESGEGVTAETAESIDASLEHFQSRLGISAKRRIRLSQEAFGGEKEARLAATKASLEEVQVLRQRLGAKVEASLEALFEGNAGALKTRKKVHDRRLMPALEKLSQANWSKGTDSGKKVKITGLGDLGGEANGAAVLKRLKQVEAGFKKGDFGGVLKEAAADVAKLAHAIETNNPEAEISTSSIEVKVARAGQVLSELTREFTSGGSVEIAFPDAQTAKGIVETLRSLAEMETNLLQGWEALVHAGEKAQEAAKKNPSVKGDQWRWAGRVIGFCVGSLPGLLVGWVVDKIRNKAKDTSATLSKTGRDAPNNAAQKAAASAAMLQNFIQAGVDYLSKTAD